MKITVNCARTTDNSEIDFYRLVRQQHHCIDKVLSSRGHKLMFVGTATLQMYVYLSEVSGRTINSPRRHGVCFRSRFTRGWTLRLIPEQSSSSHECYRLVTESLEQAIMRCRNLEALPVLMSLVYERMSSQDITARDAAYCLLTSSSHCGCPHVA